MDIILKSEILTVRKIIRKTNAEMFKDLSVGDKIMLSLPVVHVGTSRGRTYAPHIKIENLNSHEVVSKTLNEIPQVFQCFEFD